MRARDVMSTDVATVRESAPLIDAVKLLINAGASAVPVVDDKGGVVGMLSEFDVIQHLLEGRETADLQAHLEADGALPDVYARALAGPASSLMSKPAITATKDTELKDIADLMVKHRVHNIPVVGDGGVNGMVNRVALVRALLSRPTAGSAAATGAPAEAADDGRLRDAVVAAIRRLGLPIGSGFAVVVRHGAVHLWGNASTREDHRSYCTAAAQVQGVRDVQSHMHVIPL